MQRIKTDMIKGLQFPLLSITASVPCYFFLSSFFAKSLTFEPYLTNKPQIYRTTLEIKQCSDSYWVVSVPVIPTRRNDKLEQSPVVPTASFTGVGVENYYLSQTTCPPHTYNHTCSYPSPIKSCFDSESYLVFRCSLVCIR